MNIQYIVYLSFLIFLLGIFGASFSRSFLSIIISFQLIIISSLCNFFAFSLFLYTSSVWDKTFIFFAFASIYLLLFAIVFYNYSRQTNVYELDARKDYQLFKFDLSDWWGEEKPDDN